MTATTTPTAPAPRTGDATTRRSPGAVRIGAWYDLAVALPFTTPWTAALALDAVRAAHAALGLPGRAPAPFAPEHLLFVTFFGVLVTMWAVVRLVRGDRVTGVADTAGRAAFALLMTAALAAGATPVLAGFLVVEAGFLLAQARQLTRSRPARTRTSPPTSRTQETVSP
ncbi:hypothetical protein QIS99_16130 [Streptomyces sp. B-S-A8]|uniref:Integral membrane protein n=1 Tax=Streptomyces solicavernae TaxID=3043614 RepID=A0ABT6RTL8_9ACTN|nr:hypothetical protein [Streptomyces sp. B-S-A8]MDI3387715.1 hypothetical protein [Streptomyces sp. B-S-A8]